jgi:hypothetical protein
MITGHPLEKIINGPAHHTLHHLYFTCNYGQVCRSIFPIRSLWLTTFSTLHGQTVLENHTVIRSLLWTPFWRFQRRKNRNNLILVPMGFMAFPSYNLPYLFFSINIKTFKHTIYTPFDQ